VKVCALWVGDNLSYIENLSLTSCLDVGHEVDLYVYNHVDNVPKHVNVRDAREVMPIDLMIKDRRTKSPAIGADIFRLLLQKQQRGCYIDCDMVLLKPLPEEDHLFGWERHDSINSAVLRLPPDSPILADMLKLAFSDPIVPPWMPSRWRRKQRIRWFTGKHTKLDTMPWATIGPVALTYYSRQRGLQDKAKPVDVFYPVGLEDTASFFRPAAELGITPNTIAVHLWHSMIKLAADLEPLDGSWLKEQCRRLGVSDPRWKAAALAA
jgi:hypothetical protein